MAYGGGMAAAAKWQQPSVIMATVVAAKTIKHEQHLGMALALTKTRVALKRASNVMYRRNKALAQRARQLLGGAQARRENDNIKRNIKHRPAGGSVAASAAA